MSLIFVLIFYSVALAIAATVGAAVLWLSAKLYLRGISVRARLPLLLAAVFPFACALFAGAWFVTYAVINHVVFHRDPILGDGWYTPVGHGYAIEMIDITDFGYLHPEGDLNGSASIAGVRRLQLVGDEAFGTEDTKAVEHDASEQYSEDNFFHLEMATHTKFNFPSEAALATYAASRGVTLHLRPIVEVFGQFRWGWFDRLAILSLFSVPLAGLSGLLWYLRRFKRLALTSVAQ